MSARILSAEARRWALDEAVEAALNAGVKVIQQKLGATTGDHAAAYFSGNKHQDVLRMIFVQYMAAERDALDYGEST